ncbi:MAG: N-acetyl-alpha-D-glucosaminyl L-malate synthase BshA [Anaerolineaceae bacterium]|nr:N-acetyl-alpha-D-glucosaminyl L-malate synthase BshA [Anaerolineaceae bacterium]
MRIGIMCLASLGGSAHVADQLAAQFARRGHRVHLFSRTTPFGTSSLANNVKLHTVKSSLEPNNHPARLDTDWSAVDFEEFISNILQVITEEGLDVLHFHYAVPFAFLAAEVKRRLGWTTPLLVGTFHGTDVSTYGRDPIKGPELAQTLDKIDILTTVSNNHALLASELFGLRTPPIVIPNFVDLSQFRPLQAHLFPKPKIVHVSNFRSVKDPQSMARIFLRIRQQMEAELWLIGDGPEMAGVKSILQRSEFERDVHYWNLQNNVANLLAQTDLLLMTSLAESFCLAALEAMACGVPVLATDVGGLSEVVIKGKTGFLFPVGDQDMAVQLAVNLLSDRLQYQAMSQAAIRRAAAFDIERIVPLYENIYQELLLNKPVRFHASSAIRRTRISERLFTEEKMD